MTSPVLPTILYLTDRIGIICPNSVRPSHFQVTQVRNLENYAFYDGFNEVMKLEPEVMSQ
jgi:hypothetical protein